MEKKISCCGMICSGCEHYPAHCKGCREVKGKVYWLEYTGESCCDIYDCCVNTKQYQHCGLCKDLPCSRYEQGDPAKTKEENEADYCMQMKNLSEYRIISDIESLIGMLELKDNSAAYEALQELERISDETGLVYKYTQKFSDMTGSDKYVVRVRGFRLFCRQAKWDTDYILDENIDTALTILNDEKPTAVRQALKALSDVVRYKPDLRKAVKEAAANINYLRYKDTMHSLIAADIEKLLTLIDEFSE